VDLTVRVYDELLAGTLLYKQSFSAVPLHSGVYEITLGPTGAASDVPTPPVTTSLATALAGDLVSVGPGRFIEVAVDSNPPLPRSQLLSAAYALRAERAATAAAADSAAIALDVTSLNGLPVEVVSEMYEHFNFDGFGPANTDPLEGIGDVDGDGIANFVDADNDGDGFGDSQEVSLGLGVVTPNVLGVSPTSGPAHSIFDVQVSGTGFQPGMTVQFGSQVFSPFQLTPTAADVTVGPLQPGGALLRATNPNGQISPFSQTFTVSAVAFNASDHLTFDIKGTATTRSAEPTSTPTAPPASGWRRKSTSQWRGTR
jgi:hypothetical protein